MKMIPAIYLLLSSFVLHAQQPSLIEYAAISTFHWGMFQGKINKDHLAEMGQNTGAVTVSSISYSTRQTSANTASLVITARFHTQESWTRYPELNNADDALNHEKRHLEITEIYARKFRQAVTRSKFTSRHFKDEIDKLFQNVVREHRAEQVRYDSETAHSTRTDIQERWNKHIDTRLEALSAYADTTLTITLH